MTDLETGTRVLVLLFLILIDVLYLLHLGLGALGGLLCGDLLFVGRSTNLFVAERGYVQVSKGDKRRWWLLTGHTWELLSRVVVGLFDGPRAPRSYT